LILRRAAKRSPTDAARIASRVMQHIEKFDRRGDRITLNLVSLRQYNPSVAELFGEAELRAAPAPSGAAAVTNGGLTGTSSSAPASAGGLRRQTRRPAATSGSPT
jgi:hypothetical protein